MIDGLIGGKVYGKPSQRTGNSGKPFYIAKVRAATGDGSDTLLVNVIVFNEKVGTALVALEDGDSVSLSGALTPKVWTPPGQEPRPSLDMVAHAITTAYHVNKKRVAVQGSAEPKPTAKGKAAAMAFFKTTPKPPDLDADLESDLPWNEA